MRKTILTYSLLIAGLVLLSGSPLTARNISGGVFVEGITNSAEDQSAGAITGAELKYEAFHRFVFRPSFAFGKFGEADLVFAKREGSSLQVYSFDILYHVFPCEKNRYGGYFFIGRTVMYMSRSYEDDIRDGWTAIGGGVEYLVQKRVYIEANARLNTFSGGYATAGLRISINYLFKAGGCTDER